MVRDSLLMPKKLLSLLRHQLIFPLLGAQQACAAASKNNKKPQSFRSKPAASEFFSRRL